MILSIIIAIAGLALIAAADSLSSWMAIAGYVLIVIAAVVGTVSVRQRASRQPLVLTEEERHELRQLRDSEGYTDVQLVKLVRERHRGVGLVEAKQAVDAL